VEEGERRSEERGGGCSDGNGKEVSADSLAEQAERPNPQAERLSVPDILDKTGFPTDVLVLDAETYFDKDYGLKKLSVFQYVVDPRFHCHGIAVRWPDGRTEFRIDAAALVDELRGRYGPNLERVTVVAHNYQFDGLILAKHFGLHPRFVIDTVSLARHVHPGRDNSLRGLAVRYGLEEKGELAALVGVRNLDIKQLLLRAVNVEHRAVYAAA